MRVTILGATGFIGRHLSKALRARGDEVVEAGVRDPAAAAAASAGSDAVVNLAGAPVAVRWTAA
nr:NAD-dependent epimerase/dehydratase family protein [Candidatus Eremiobacteraeota bacterium]